MNTSIAPIVSVIIPTYNRAHHIVETVESVLQQVYQNFELIVIDDGSTDNTEEVLKPYRDQIHYIHQVNGGVSQARNRGINEARGEYIAFLDDDDLWLPEKLEAQVEYLEANPEVGMVHVNMFIQTNSDVSSSKTSYQSHPCPTGYILSELFKGLPILPSSVLIRKECLEATGSFDEEIRYSEDNHLWMRVARHFPIGYIHKSLGIYRVHGANVSGNYVRDQIGAVTVREKLLRLDPEMKNEIDTDAFRIGLIDRTRFLAYELFDKGNYREARKYYLRLVKFQPSRLANYFYYFSSMLPHSLIFGMRKIKRKCTSFIKNLVHATS